MKNVHKYKEQVGKEKSSLQLGWNFLITTSQVVKLLCFITLLKMTFNRLIMLRAWRECTFLIATFFFLFQQYLLVPEFICLKIVVDSNKQNFYYYHHWNKASIPSFKKMIIRPAWLSWELFNPFLTKLSF